MGRALLAIALIWITTSYVNALNTVKCKSFEDEVIKCNVGAPIERLVLLQQLSPTRCRFGINYLKSGGYVLVRDGCGAIFAYTRVSGVKNIKCKSRNYEVKSCCVRDSILKMYLIKELSRDRCFKGRTYVKYHHCIKVARGCHALFALKLHP